MAHHQQDAHPLPPPAHARQVPGDLLGQVAGPDDQELREVEVGPQHHEGQQELAQVVQVVGPDDTRQRLGARQQHDDGDREGHRRQALPAHEQDAVDRREPVRVDRHHPVDRHEEDRQGVEDQAAAAQPLHPHGAPAVVPGVLLQRPRRQHVGQRRPDRKVDGRADVEERHVQVRLLELEDRVVFDHLRPRPHVQLADAEGDGQEQHRHERHRAARRLEHAPGDHAPGAARQVVHHRPGQRPQGHAHPEHKRHQVRAEEVLVAGRVAQRHQAQPDDAHAQREALDAGNAGGHGIRGVSHLHGVSRVPPAAQRAPARRARPDRPPCRAARRPASRAGSVAARECRPRWPTGPPR